MIYAQPADRTEKTIAVSPDVTVSLFAEGTGIKVRGWERDEVRVSSATGREIEVKRTDDTKVKNSATLLQVRVYGFPGEINLNVPRKATIKIHLLIGNVSVEDVAAAHVTAQSGGITLRRISRLVEASSIGNILLKDAGGVISLKSVSGIIEASNVRPINQSDGVRINSVSGDVLLERVAHYRIEVTTVNGNILFLGPPAKETICNFDTNQGDIALYLTADVSFQVTVILGEKGKFTNEFPLKTVGDNNSPGSRRINGSYGTGGSTFTLASFIGQVHLRRKE